MPWKRMRQEIFNSPYATNMFRKYAERIGWTPESKDSFDVSKTESESVRMLSEAAKEHGIWLIGGELHVDHFYEESLKFTTGGHAQARFLNCRKTTRSTTLRLRSTRTANSLLCTEVSHVNTAPEPRPQRTQSGIRLLVSRRGALVRHRHPQRHHFQGERDSDWRRLADTY
jgi:hypothetical protein